MLGVPREVSSGIGSIAARFVSPSTCLPPRIGWELKRMDLDTTPRPAGPTRAILMGRRRD